jgi:transcriptional regulator with XRE-family HTH domain
MIGSKVKARLEELGMRQADLARKSGLSTGYVSDLVNGHRGRYISITNLKRLCEALEVEPSFFYPNNSNVGNKGSTHA